jgi:hypothetical protein
MQLVIETKSVPLVIDLQNDPPDGVNVRMHIEGQRSFGDAMQTAEAIISMVALSGQFAPWLIGKLKKHKTKKIKINGIEIEADENTINAVLQKLQTESNARTKEDR